MGFPESSLSSNCLQYLPFFVSCISHFTIGDLLFSLKGLVSIKMHILLWAGTDRVNNYLWFSTRGFICFFPFGKGERRERTCFRLFWRKEETGCRMRKQIFLLIQWVHPQSVQVLVWMPCPFLFHLGKQQLFFLFFPFPSLNLLKFKFWDNHSFPCNCKNEYREIPCALYPVPPMVTSYKTILEYHNQDTDIAIVKTLSISITMRILMLSFHNHTYIPFHPSLSLMGGNHCFHLYHFVVSRMLYKWNHIVCNLWGLVFSLSIFL